MSVHEPILHPVALADLKPTQITVGMHEVEQKRERWRKLSKEKGAAFLGRHMIPTVIGPKGRHYLTDNHHLARRPLCPEQGLLLALSRQPRPLPSLRRRRTSRRLR